AVDMSTSTRKRKIRKGTQSCWECKRRKTRCIFAAPVDSACVGCKSRRTTCLSQEFHEEISTIPKKATQTKRLAPSTVCSSPHRLGREGTAESRPEGPKVPQKEPFLPSETYHHVYCALAEAWPGDYDLDVIKGVTVEDFSILYGPLNGPCSNLEFQHNLSPQGVLELPPYGAHPVLVARKALLLSVFLRRFPLQDSSDTQYSGDTADRLFNQAIRLITTNDELLNSVEGIECVALESMVHNYCGNLRRALLSLRKAMVLAQLMGLHRKAHSPSLKVIDPQIRARIDFNYIWFRLVESDRYLSLMLGAPQAWSDNTFLEKKALAICSPEEQLERLLLIVGGRILDRNERDVQDLAVTQEIDHLLQRASSCMAPQWWLVPEPSQKSVDDQMWTRQIMIQVTHYFLLTQLHFPYLMDSSDSHTVTYSKMTAINASRDILFRFLALRSDATLNFYCRGVDIIAFFASAALCLAHIAGSHGYQTPFYYLTHQRVSDRGLVEKTLEHMERTSRSSDDLIASRLIDLLHTLLIMESTSKTGAVVTMDFTPDGYSEDNECSGQISDGGNALHIFIPHCGKIDVTRTTVDVDPTFSSQFNLDVECFDPIWVSEATQPIVDYVGTQTPEYSEFVGDGRQSETHG
ncbi:hypothetical protein P171DRAFT_364028, partial [Karstenula rhodostoma CBS 690.94]